LLNKPERAGTPNGGYITAPWSLGKSQVRPDAIRQLGKFAEFYACLSNAAIQFAPNSYEFMEKVLFASKIQAARDCLRSGYSMVGRQRKRLLTLLGDELLRWLAADAGDLRAINPSISLLEARVICVTFVRDGYHSHAARPSLRIPPAVTEVGSTHSKIHGKEAMRC